MTDYLAGTIGGVTGILLSHPIDTIRIRFQTRKVGDVIKLNNLYRGVSSPLIGMGMEKAIVFGVYNHLYKKTNNDFVSGLGAGLACTSIVTPVEKIKINMQNGMSYRDILSKIITIKDLYKGFTPTLFREVPGFAIYFSTYNYLKEKLDVKSESQPFKTMMIGGSSGVAAWFFIYPSDVVKSRLQSESLGYKNMRECITHTYQTHGLKFFFSGMSLALLRAFQLHAGVWVGYEFSKQILNNI